MYVFTLEEVSHFPTLYSADKSLVLYILLFRFVDSGRDDKNTLMLISAIFPRN